MNRLPDNPTDEISELLAGYALGALEREEHEFVARNLPRRPRWRQELAEYRRVATALAYVPQERDVPLRVRAALLAEIARLEAPVPLASQNIEAAVRRTQANTQRQLPEPRGIRRVLPRFTLAAAMPVTIVAIIFALHTVIMQGQMNEQQNELAEFAQLREDTIEVLLSETQAPTMVELSSTNEAPLARGRVFVDPVEKSAVLTVRHLPPVKEHAAYIVWIASQPNPSEYIRVGELRIGENDAGQTTISPNRLSTRVFVFITLESDPEAQQPTGPTVMSGSL